VPYTDIRVRHVRTGPGRLGGDYVLYWIQAYRRLESNHALDEALRRADEAGKPLVVYEGLRLDYPWASLRHHRFILEGMQVNREAATRLGLAYWPFVETEPGAGRGLVARLAERATLVVTDDFPCFVVPDQTEALARHVTVPVLAVDGNTIVPLARLQGQGPAVTTAAHLRPRIHRDFADAWEHRASATPRVPRVARSSLLPPFPVADLGDVDGLLARLPVDRSVSAVVGMPGGTVAARRRLEEFLARRLTGYAESRSEPSPPEAVALCSWLLPCSVLLSFDADDFVSASLDWLTLPLFDSELAIATGAFTLTCCELASLEADCSVLFSFVALWVWFTRLPTAPFPMPPARAVLGASASAHALSAIANQ